MKEIHYFYKITNLINKKFYYGIRTCRCLPGKDPYIGSGVYLHRAYKKYGIKNFKKEILRVCRTKEDASDLERWMVTEELVRDPRCYNIIVGGDNPESYYGGVRCYIGGKYVVVSIDEYKSNLDKYTSIMKGKVFTEIGLVDKNEARDLNLTLSSAYIKKGESILYDTVLGEYTRITSDEYKMNKDRYKCTVEMRGGLTKESKLKISYTMKELIRNGKNDHLKRRRWMNNGVINKRVLESEVDTYISNNWVLGRIY